ncbi:MAG: GNAT family N-acetyltransferase [Firmicutes bacterium]|nr:GNAT family N-acetyltransferase [Bacillota bacterium]
MKKIKLVAPSLEHKYLIMDYKREFIENEDSMDGTASLRNTETYEEWYQLILDNSCEETVKKDLVPASTYLGISVKDGRLIGMIDIRHRLNDFLFNYGGHIGYSIRKSERQKGYATEMLSLALRKCSNLGMDRVLITCDKKNIASAKTIIKNGGELENEVLEENEITQRYWIKL